MPLYGFLLNPPALYPGDSYDAVVKASGDAQGAVGGLNTTGNRSQQIAIARAPWSQTSPQIRIDLRFDGDPGAINFQVQEASTDSLSDYVTVATLGTITSAVLAADGVTYIASVDIYPFNGLFVLIFCDAQSANNVKLTSAKVSR